MNLNLFGHELVVDNFAGGGGASEGIEQALGRPVDLAINHDATAIAVHTANHPGSEHSVADVWDVDPEQATRGMPVGLAWFSPDCRHHSKAKGGRPVSKSVRGLAWVAARWAAKVKPRVIILENVEEFQDWGPLIKDDQARIVPDPARKGQTFRGFVGNLRRHGYQVDWRLLRACDYGTPTIRRRLFLIARRDGLPICWPKPTHAAPEAPAVRRGKMQPHRTAAECIDWSIPCPSIFSRNRPLAENTMKRIAKGVMRYVVEAEQPFIVTCNHGGEGFRGQSLLEPMKTVTAAHDAHGLVVPHITKFRSGAIGHACDEPMHTITANSNVEGTGTNPGGAAPFGLVAATMVQTGYGERPGQAPRAIGLQKPLGTVVAGGQKHALVSAFLAKHFTGVVGDDLRNPVPTVTATDHNALVAANLVNLKGADRGGRDLREPMPTVCAGGTHAAAVAAFLAPYYGSGSGETGRDLRAPAPTVTTKDRFQLITVLIDGERYVITDIGMRMLQPHELAAAQGFPDGYKFAEVNGRPVPKYVQVRLIGNSVCPPLARAIVAANFTHEKQFMPAPAAAVA
ncbi:DNA (cytosine-5)-methyltransferase 1 [Modicisalibacter muralis]|uniref:DNA (cytosine-5-)-methyltransferase n=1 Tax=Modicisalibacter muralis TaxID=119000 RepID=A0A1G9MYF7_9GAMM|nr:DNA cytosine methyltransferase [Halomonas muralis]SDL78917.1 DNA (cytosine-5)-methyltransferase 1 [Halomonas muralis]